MILEFSVGNFRSFEEIQTFSLVAADLPGEELAETHVARIGNHRLLRCAALYGANASGKSNLHMAMMTFSFLARDSSPRLQEGDTIPVVPFALRSRKDFGASYFELVFLIEGRKYRYGFEATPTKIESEWLFVQKSSRETTLFTRKGQEISVNKKEFREGDGKEEATRSNALFLSLVAQLNGKIAKKILAKLQTIKAISGLRDHGYAAYTASCLFQKEHPHRAKVLEMLRRLDLSFEDVRVTEAASASDEDVEGEIKVSLPSAQKTTELEVELLHPVYDQKGKRIGDISLDLGVSASEGTRKLFGLIGPLVDALEKGLILWIDEMDARLHPLITRNLVALFNSPVTNPCNGQLIFNTHDSNLLTPRLLRRDQIWFAEKDRVGATNLYSLAEFRQDDGTLARPNANFEDQYIQGRYGAVPFLGDFAALFASEEKQESCASDCEQEAVTSG
ncbi:MAG: ATP-binding protein [Armatimonadetes bacterium]|nr:ATP-binding protein [Armatimonadota bacterium]